MKSSFALLLLGGLLLAACDDSSSDPGGPDADIDADDKPSLDDFLPDVPAPDGTAQVSFAGEIASASQLLPGDSRTALVGDYFMRNDKVSFAIQAPGRFIGVVPWGGNVIDAVPLEASGQPAADDHLGEISMIYLAGRTCAHETMQVLRDGSGGGAAVLRAIGKARANDFINLQGIGILPLPSAIDPYFDDGVECATTYTLAPGATQLELAWTLFAGGTFSVDGPFGTLNDTGGDVESFAPLIGFERVGIDAILEPGDPQPVPYVLFQGPDVAYGLLPTHEDGGEVNATVLVAGVSLLIYGVPAFLDFVDSNFVSLVPGAGKTFEMSLVVGRQGVDIDAAYRERKGEALVEVSGTVSFTGAGPAAGARVGVYTDVDGNGQLDATDKVLTYFDARADGSFAGKLPAGSYLVRGDIRNVARGPAQVITVAAAPLELAVTLPAPATLTYQILDGESGQPVPAKITVVGVHPALPDERVQDAYDQLGYVIKMEHSVHGDSAEDGVIRVPAGGPYRVLVSRGPEWSIASQLINPAPGATLDLDFEIFHVLDTEGYAACEFHQHAYGSPDSPVPTGKRLATLAAEGVEFFASTDHDFLTDYDPLIDDAGLRGTLDAVVGIEATPFAYGHFIAFPLDYDENDPTHGAVDWATGGDGFAMLPSVLWSELRERGAEIVQVNHPRSSSLFTDFQSYFDVAGLEYDREARTFATDPASLGVPLEWIHLPEGSPVFSDAFDTLEVWNGFGPEDIDSDGQREMTSLDRVLRDWFNFLSFGKIYTPIGNSDTHTRDSDAAGLPRTMVRVDDDSSAGVLAGVDEDVYTTLLGKEGAPRDVVITNGPMLTVTVDGQPAIGRTFAPDGSITLTITATAPAWMDFDTIEVLSNSFFLSGSSGPLAPIACFTSRPLGPLPAGSTCKAAPLPTGSKVMTVELVPVRATGQFVRRATVTVTVAESDIPGDAFSQGSDAYLVARVRGNRAVYPMMTNGAISEANVAQLVSGEDAAVAAALDNVGIPAMAMTGAIFVDFDGGGWRGPYQP